MKNKLLFGVILLGLLMTIREILFKIYKIKDLEGIGLIVNILFFLIIITFFSWNARNVSKLKDKPLEEAKSYVSQLRPLFIILPIFFLLFLIINISLMILLKDFSLNKILTNIFLILFGLFFFYFWIVSGKSNKQNTA